MTDHPPLRIAGEPGDKAEALRLGHQLRSALPPLMARAVGDELYWLAERTSLVGRKRYLDLAAEARSVVTAAAPADAA